VASIAFSPGMGLSRRLVFLSSIQVIWSFMSMTKPSTTQLFCWVLTRASLGRFLDVGSQSSSLRFFQGSRT
jgi:hypothetical protein